MRQRPLRAWLLLLLLLVPALASGGTITLPYTFSPGTKIESAQVNSNFSTIYNEFNGNISDANINAVTEAKITFSATGHDHSGTSKGALVAVPRVDGWLGYSNATQISFSPANGNRIYIKKSGLWTATTIPSAGIMAANTNVYVDGVAGQNLAAATTYYVCLFDNAGTLTVDFISFATGHAADTATGLQIKTGDDTRLLIGMVRTTGASQFSDGNALRGVRSYYNRRPASIVNTFSANRSTTSLTYTELNSEIRANFLMWGDEAAYVAVNGRVDNGTGAEGSWTSVGFDGTNKENAHAVALSPFGVGSVTLLRTGLTEGFHYATVLGATSAGSTGTWYGGTYAANTSIQNLVSLAVVIQ